MRLLHAADIPQYSSEAIALIESALTVQLQPLGRQMAAEPQAAGLDPKEGISRIINSAIGVFARLIKQYRRDGGLSITHVANHSGTTPAELSRWENGLAKPPTGKVLLRLIQALEIPFHSHAAVEIVLAAGLPHLDDEVLLLMAEHLK